MPYRSDLDAARLRIEALEVENAELRKGLEGATATGPAPPQDDDQREMITRVLIEACEQDTFESEGYNLLYRSRCHWGFVVKRGSTTRLYPALYFWPFRIKVLIMWKHRRGLPGIRDTLKLSYAQSRRVREAYDALQTRRVGASFDRTRRDLENLK